jgi:SET domain-containing protein
MSALDTINYFKKIEEKNSSLSEKQLRALKRIIKFSKNCDFIEKVSKAFNLEVTAKSFDDIFGCENVVEIIRAYEENGHHPTGRQIVSSQILRDYLLKKNKNLI